MESTRIVENRHEFAKASEVSLAFRHGLAKYSNRFNSKELNAKMTKIFLGLIKKDTTNVRGNRTLKPENIVYLKNLVLSESSAPNLFIFQNFAIDIVGTADIKAVLTFDGDIVPAVHFKKSESATHIQLTVVLLLSDFSQNNASKTVEASKFYDLNDAADQSQNIETVAIPVIPGYNAVALLFVLYFQEVNSVKYLLSNKKMNSSIIADIKPL